MRVAIVYTEEVPGTSSHGPNRISMFAVQREDGLWEIPGQEGINPFSVDALRTVELLDTDKKEDLLHILWHHNLDIDIIVKR